MRACKEYREAPNPKPKPVTVIYWVLTDQRGRFKRYLDDGTVRLWKSKPDGLLGAMCFGEYRGGPIIWKPRRVCVRITPL